MRFEPGQVAHEARSLQAALARLCAELDPDSVQLPEAPGLWSSFAEIERLAAGAKCRLARKVDESRAWQQHGDRSAADWMARMSGTSSGRARAELETSQRLQDLPATDKAVSQGELSDQQACAVADAASADPAAEASLLSTARSQSVRDLKEACGRTKARAEDEQARAERLHRQRALRTWTASDGSWNLSTRNTPEVGARLEAAIRAETERIFTEARLAGRHEPQEAYAADALTALLLGEHGDQAHGTGRAGSEDLAAVAAEAVATRTAAATSQRPPAERQSRRPDTKVIVLVDYEALKRGHAEAGETCEIAGVGPVPVATVRGLMTDAFGAAIVTDGVDVFNVAHLGRTPTAQQRTALEARGYVCEVPGCGATLGLEIDHIADWHETHRTCLDQLCWLCKRHHHDKTHCGWRLSGAPGERSWHPPDHTSGSDPPGDPPGTLFNEPAA